MDLILDYPEKVNGIQPEVYSPNAMVDKVKGSRVNMKAVLDTHSRIYQHFHAEHCG